MVQVKKAPTTSTTTMKPYLYNNNKKYSSSTTTATTASSSLFSFLNTMDFVRLGMILVAAATATWVVYATFALPPPDNRLRQHDDSVLESSTNGLEDSTVDTVDALESINSWCSTPECHQRLEELKSKMELEEIILDVQKRINEQRAHDIMEEFASHRLPTKEEVLEWRFSEIREGSVETYYPKEEWKELGSFPELNVVGNLKTGTSQLYNVLNSHRDVGSIEDDWKEHCSTDHYGTESPEQDTYEYALHGWHNFYYSRKQWISETEAKPQVNGCVGLFSDMERRYAYNPPKGDAKFFILLRDPADWSWAAYNFFCDPSWEDYEPDDNWVDDKKHYRSPEVFHEVVLSGGKLLGYGLLSDMRERSVSSVRRIRTIVGSENLMVIKNEDLQPHRIQSSGLLERLSEFTGLPMDGWDPDVVHSRSNCNANKGYGEKCNDDRDVNVNEHSHPRVGYPVTQNRAMFDATRQYIYVQWYAECKIWAEEFGIVYPDCLAAIEEIDEEQESL